MNSGHGLSHFFTYQHIKSIKSRDWIDRIFGHFLIGDYLLGRNLIIIFKPPLTLSKKLGKIEKLDVTFWKIRGKISTNLLKIGTI